MNLSRSLAVASLVGLSAAPCWASSISYSFGTQGCGVATTSSGTCDSGGTIFNWSAFGSLTTLKLAMDYDATNAGNLDSTRVGGGVTVSDLITITGGAVGSGGTLRVDWAIDGILTTGGAGDLTLAELDSAGATVAEWRACGATNTHCAGFSAVADETVSIVIPFVFGTPVSTAFALRGGTSGGSVAFFDTAELQPFLVFDSLGHQIGASATSSDGSAYAVAAPAAAEVPEPGSFMLLGVGLGAALWRRSTRRT